MVHPAVGPHAQKYALDPAGHKYALGPAGHKYALGPAGHKYALGPAGLAGGVQQRHGALHAVCTHPAACCVRVSLHAAYTLHCIKYACQASWEGWTLWKRGILVQVHAAYVGRRTMYALWGLLAHTPRILCLMP